MLVCTERVCVSLIKYAVYIQNTWLTLFLTKLLSCYRTCKWSTLSLSIKSLKKKRICVLLGLWRMDVSQIPGSHPRRSVHWPFTDIISIPNTVLSLCTIICSVLSHFQWLKSNEAGKEIFQKRLLLILLLFVFKGTEFSQIIHKSVRNIGASNVLIDGILY